MERKVGFAKLDLNPRRGLQMTGYFEDRFAEGQLDPIYLIAIGFEEDGKRSVIITSDTLGCYADVAYEFPHIVAEANGIDADAVFISHNHSHTSPHIDSYRIPGDVEFLAKYKRSLCEVTKMAFEDLKPLKEVRIAEGETHHLTFSRRVKLKDGTYRTWSKCGDPELESFAGACDESVRVMRFIREEGKEVVLVNFQCHPDDIAGEMYSADYPGAFRRAFEFANPNTQAMFMQGAEGQMIGVNYFNATPQPKCPFRAYSMGQKLADQVQPIYERAEVLTDDVKMAYGRITIQAKTKYDPSRLEKSLEIIKNHEEGHWELNAKTRQQDIWFVSEAYILRDLINKEIKSIDLILSYLTFAGIGFIGIPGEPFCELGIEIRKGSPFKMTNIGCHTNGSEGYFSVAEAYDHGGYEPHNTRFVKGITEEMIDASVKKLKEIHS